MEKVLSQILDELKTLNRRVGNIESDVTGLKSAVTGLKSDVTGLKSDVTGLKSDVTGLKSAVTELKFDVTDLKSDVLDLKKGQQRIETRIENEVVDKIRGLFDAREVQNDKLDQINYKLTDIDDSVTYALAKVARHEAKLIGAK